MPRGPGLDAPGVLHHMMGRGLEWHPLFRDARDRADFIARRAARAVSLPMARVARALGISPTVGREGVERGEAPLRGRGLSEASLRPGRWQQA